MTLLTLGPRCTERRVREVPGYLVTLGGKERGITSDEQEGYNHIQLHNRGSRGFSVSRASASEISGDGWLANPFM
jgi:hypothetical protein